MIDFVDLGNLTCVNVPDLSYSRCAWTLVSKTNFAYWLGGSNGSIYPK